MKMTKSGLVVGFTQNDLNHCGSDFLVYAKNWRRVGAWPRLVSGMRAAISLIGEMDRGDGVRVRAVGDVWTWDANAGADRRYYCAETRKVGFEPLEG